MPKRGQTQDYQMLYQEAPERTEQGGTLTGGKRSFSTVSAAVEAARGAIMSRRIRAPQSHVLVQDKTTNPPTVLLRWDGCDPDGTDYLTINDPLAKLGYTVADFGIEEE